MNVALFVTCLADHYFADAAADAVRLLRHLGCEVSFPPDQSCCGQPAHNAGLPEEARRMADHTRRALDGAEAVVVPSGSCATMLKKVYPELGDGQREGTRGRDLPGRTWELAEFLVHKLGVHRLGSGLRGRRVALHQGCHALRELGLKTEPAQLLLGAGAQVVPWQAQDECCGFGGLFSVKMAAVSAAMADRKLETIPDDVDWVVSGDPGCLLHLEGRSRARGHGPPFRHLASVLWQAVDGREGPAEGSQGATDR